MKELAGDIFGAEAASKQEGNGFQTGSASAESAGYLYQLISGWEERRHGVLLLKALCALVSHYPERAPEGYTALELAEAVEQEGGPDWYRVAKEKPDAEKAIRQVRKHWKIAKEIWAEHQEGVSQRFADRQPVVVPDYDKYETKGGTGNPSRYQLQFKVPSPHAETIPTDTAFRVPPQSGLSKTPDPFAPMVRYYTETVRKTRILGHLEIGGFLLSGWRKVMFLSVALTTLLVILAISWISMIALSHAPDTHAFVRIAVTFAIVASTVWVFVGWFVRLVVNRVTMAPLLLQDWSGHDDRVMELRWDEEHQTNRILIKRYVADCPICEGKVRVQPGRRQFPSRLVGRCGAAPTEHVFSFDPIVRVGIHLHWPHPYAGHRRPDV